MNCGIDRNTVLATLSHHIGKANGIAAKDVVADITWQAATEAQCRKLRTVVEELRREGHHICAHPSTGYFIGETTEEVDETCKFLVDRAMTSLSQAAAIKKRSLPDLHGQLGLKI